MRLLYFLLAAGRQSSRNNPSASLSPTPCPSPQNNNLAGNLLASHGLGPAPGAFPLGVAPAAAPPQRAPSPALPAGLSLDFLGFSDVAAQPRRPAPSSVKAVPAPAPAGGVLLGGAPSLPSPLSSSPPFCYSEVEARLRTEFSGGVSHFLQPAAEEPGALAPLALPASL